MGGLTLGQLEIELIRILGQVALALLVARLAVRWALARYKREKTWERRLAAYVDAVAAISEMKKVVGDWCDELIERRDVSEEYQRKRRERYSSARRTLDEGIATALLILPNETAKTLHDLDEKLAAASQQDGQFEILDEELACLGEALEELIQQGREELGIH